MTFVLVIVLLRGVGFNESRAITTVPGFSAAGECWSAAAETIAGANAKKIQSVDAYCIPGPRRAGEDQR